MEEFLSREQESNPQEQRGIEEPSQVLVALTKTQVEELIAKKGYVCDRCDRKWVRTHHEK